MIALGRLLQANEVLGELLLRCPCRSVDPLQHRLVFIASPIRAGDAHQLEVPEAPVEGT